MSSKLLYTFMAAGILPLSLVSEADTVKTARRHRGSRGNGLIARGGCWCSFIPISLRCSSGSVQQEINTDTALNIVM